MQREESAISVNDEKLNGLVNTTKNVYDWAKKEYHELS